MNEYCNRCDNSVSRSRPCCSNCGLWLPWGDRAVVELRKERRRKYEEQERKFEHAFQVSRRAPDARILQAEPLAFWFLRCWHLGQFSQARKLAVCAALAGVMAASGTLWALGGQKGAPQARERAKNEVLTAVCNDGTVLNIRSRQGACSGRRGVLKFISETT